MKYFYVCLHSTVYAQCMEMVRQMKWKSTDSIYHDEYPTHFCVLCQAVLWVLLPLNVGGVCILSCHAIQTIHIVGIIQIRVLFPKSFWKNKIRVSLSILMHWQGNRERDPFLQFPHENTHIKWAKLCTQILGLLDAIYLAFLCMMARRRGQYVNIRQNQSNLFAPFGDKTLPLSYHHTTPLA